MNWKVGDKFVVLPSAENIAVPRRIVGTVRTIIHINGNFMYCTSWGYRLTDGRKSTKLDRALA